MIIEYSIDQNFKPVIHHWYRNGKEKKHVKIIDFQPYFYIEEKYFDETKKYDGMKSFERGYKSLYNTPLIKINCKSPKYVSKMRKDFKAIYEKDVSYEADILFENRYLIDKGVSFGDFPKVMYWDIEVLHEKGIFPEPNDEKEDGKIVKQGAQYKIGSITFTSNYTNIYYTLVLDEKQEELFRSVNKSYINRSDGKNNKWKILVYNEEKSMLEKFVELVKKSNCDIWTGWNTDFFDLPYLINRMKILHLDYNMLSPLGFVRPSEKRLNLSTGRVESTVPNIKGINMFDLLIPYKKMKINKQNSYKLGNVGEKEIGIKKVEFEGDVIDLYTTDKNKFIYYNIADVEICKELDNKIGIIKYFFELAKFIGCKVGDTMSNSRMGDIYALKYCKEKGICLPSKKHTSPETFQGAKVFDPIVGKHKKVIVLDLAKIYPSAIISMNASPETVDKENGEIKIGNGMAFTNKFVGFSPEVLKRLFEIREIKKKKKKQFSIDSKEWEDAKLEEQFVKDLINSFYGLLSYAGYRLYSPDIGASVTYMGRQIIEQCEKKIKEKGYEIIYGDTDSIFIQSKSDNPTEEGKILEKYINDSFDDFASKFGIKDHVFSIEFEKWYRSLIFMKKQGNSKSGAKKRYIGFLSYQDGQILDKLEYKGIESKRSDSSELTRDIMLNVFKMILNDKEEDIVDEYIKNKLLEFEKLDIEDIAIPKGINQELKDYAGVDKNGRKKTPSANIRGTIYVNKVFKTTMGKGSKSKYVYIKEKNHGKKRKYPKTDVVAFESKTQLNNDFWDYFKIDFKLMKDKLIINKLKPIYDVMGWIFKGDQRQKSIGDWQ